MIESLLDNLNIDDSSGFELNPEEFNASGSLDGGDIYDLPDLNHMDGLNPFSGIESSSMVHSPDLNLSSSSEISFTSHIDDLYDPNIQRAADDYIHHIEAITDSHNADDIKYHADKALEATHSKEYWEHSKHDAEITSEKDGLFLEHINNQLDIIDKTQRDIEAIYNGTNGQVSFGSSELSEPNLEADNVITPQISFGRVTSWQDSGFQEFKNYLNYHCHISSSEIPYTHDLIDNNGDYDLSAISKIETWVRKLYASDKISNYDEDQLFKYLNRMK